MSLVNHVITCSFLFFAMITRLKVKIAFIQWNKVENNSNTNPLTVNFEQKHRCTGLELNEWFLIDGIACKQTWVSAMGSSRSSSSSKAESRAESFRSPLTSLSVSSTAGAGAAGVGSASAGAAGSGSPDADFFWKSKKKENISTSNDAEKLELKKNDWRHPVELSQTWKN